MSRFKKLTTIAAVAALALGLAACGGGDDTVMEPTPPPTPTPYEMAKTNIAAAGTAAEAQAAYDAVKDAVTASEGDRLQALVDDRADELAQMAREADQKAALMTAAGMIDTSDLSTQALVDAARTAIAGLRQALDDADDVSDADKGMYMSQLTGAVDAVDMAQGGIDTATRRMNQMTALSDASGTLQTALAALSGSTPTQAQLDAANTALTALNNAITGGGDLTDTEKAPYQREANNAAAPIQTAQMAFDDAEDDAEDARNAAMAVTAAKLYAGISAPMGDPASPGNDDRAARYDTTNATTIEVFIGDGNTPSTAVVLTEDKKTTVADNDGWEGKRYARTSPASDGTYEAVVYSNVEEPTPGARFSTVYTANITAGVLAATIVEATANSGRVASPSFDQSSGVKRFPFPEENPNNQSTITIGGSFHGVPGTYSCTPGGTAVCAVRVAAEGFELGTVPSATDVTWTAASSQWTFKPSNANARVMSAMDTAYASYGWWLHKPLTGTWSASAFHDFKGTATTVDIADLGGTATYMGGAAGKYALSSSTGGTNDAGHFTARATLEADFEDDTIAGTIDYFMGADGEARDWSVELKEAALADSGEITRAAADDTVWTIGGTAAAASGEWSGDLREEDNNGVPKAATGTFYTEHGRDGHMVGAFGANQQ
ncbi:MAG: hypothetical protein OXC28_26770 [Defluviicoccus sp.]|nr:hypothetical protein [Defluviicoccus sp.]